MFLVNVNGKIPNMNEVTGVPFGYISAHELDSEVVQELMYGAGAKDLSYAETVLDLTEKFKCDFEEELEAMDEVDAEAFIAGKVEEELEHWQCDEPIVAGVYLGVKYRSSWLGGALNFFIFESPKKGYFRPCSPCVPGAGDLGSPVTEVCPPEETEAHTSGIWCYDVPEDWRSSYVD